MLSGLVCGFTRSLPDGFAVSSEINVKMSLCALVELKFHCVAIQGALWISGLQTFWLRSLWGRDP